MFLVYLQIWNRNLIRYSFWLAFLEGHFFENLFNSTRDNPSLFIVIVHTKSFHGVRFPGSSLAIGDYGWIIASDHCRDRSLGGIFIDMFLGRLLRIDVVELKILNSVQVVLGFKVLVDIIEKLEGFVVVVDPNLMNQNRLKILRSGWIFLVWSLLGVVV